MSGSFGDDKDAQVGVAVSLSILLLANVVGNTLVIFIILTNRSMKSPMNYLLLNLAVADIMVVVFLAPRFVFNQFFTHPSGLAGKVLCSILTRGNISWLAQAASCFFLVAISVERYVAIMHPRSVKYRLSMRKVKSISIGSWICALVMNAPLFFIGEYDKRQDMCVDHWPQNEPALFKAYSFAWFILIGLMPIAIMFVLYSRVIYSLWFKQRQVQGTQLAMLRARKRVTKMVVIVSVVYAVCILPNLIFYVLEENGNILLVLSVVLIACNSAINPFIYTLQSSIFRRHLIKLLLCGKICRNRLDIQREFSVSHRTNEHNGPPVRLNTFTMTLNKITN